MKIFGLYILSKNKVAEWYDRGWNSAAEIIYSSVSGYLNTVKKEKKPSKDKINEIQECLDMTYKLMKGIK